MVYNHTAEGDGMGPMLSFKGVDNPAYYRLDPADPRRYVDYTGTGNSLNMRHPHVLQLIMDSLRYWVLEMHVDGFRFDLAATLARELHDVDKLSSFFDLIQQDPVISQVKLIAEPWDVGEGGYQVGNFPPLWSEWNGKYRDEVRDFWRGADNTVAEFAYRFTGSSDLYESNGRTPNASINFVTCHDGFTLTDLVSYNDKHNDANGEDNRDGTTDNRSWNCGVEGPTDDPDDPRPARPAAPQLPGHPVPVPGRADAERRRRARPHPARQQQRLRPGQRGLLVRLGGRRRRPDRVRAAARAPAPAPPGVPAPPVVPGPAHHGRGDRRHRVVHPGRHVDDRRRLARSASPARSACSSTARPSPRPGPRGERIVDDSFYAIFNAYDGELDFTLPDAIYGDRWVRLIDTARRRHRAAASPTSGGSASTRSTPATQLAVAGHSAVLLRRATPDD